MNKKHLLLKSILSLAGTALLVAGCQSEKSSSGNSSTPVSAPPPAALAAPLPAATAASEATPVTTTPVRINAGASEATTDKAGNSWLADSGFVGGDIIERPDVTITNAADQKIYQSEHYSMDSFSWPVANGKYLVKLHFCETYEGISGPGERVFSFNVQGKQFDNFDVWAKAGGPFTAYVESVPVEVNNGKLQITFTSNVENPQINGIEIIPQH